MDSLFAQIEALALQADTVGRHKALDLLRSLQLKLETPHDTLSRFSGMVRDPGGCMRLFDSGEATDMWLSIWRSPQLELRRILKSFRPWQRQRAQ